MRMLPRTAVLILLFTAGIFVGGHGIYIYAKALLAQQLIAQAWRESLATREAVKPWPWADTWPVARLLVPGLDVDLYVLAGDNASSLAFGPGRRSGTQLISAHRDTHFRFLNRLQAGEAIVLQEPNGRWHRYIVTGAAVIHESTPLLQEMEPATLALLTCYPFDAIVPGGPWRYVVFAQVSPGKIL